MIVFSAVLLVVSTGFAQTKPASAGKPTTTPPKAVATKPAAPAKAAAAKPATPPKAAVTATPAKGNAVVLKNAIDSMSYAIGMLDANFFKTQGITSINP